MDLAVILQKIQLGWLKAEILAKKIGRTGYALRKNQISRYPAFLEQFEQRYARLLQRQYGLTFCNGTSAIEAALFAANIRPGDQVIVPSCTFHASIDPIVNAGAEPVFADVEDTTFTLDPEDVKRKLTNRTKAVIVVHVWGFPAAMERLQQVLASSGRSIPLIEDVSHAHGASWAGRPCGAWGEFGMFSLQGSKAVAAGEGGIVVTDSQEHYLRMSAWGHFDRHGDQFMTVGLEDFRTTGMGYKRRMAPLGAILADVDLDYLDTFNRLKQKHVDRLDEALGTIPGLEVPRLPSQARRGGFYQGYPVKITSPDVTVPAVLTTLHQMGIQATAYPFPLHHKLPIYTNLAYRQGLMAQQPMQVAAQTEVCLPVTEYLQSQLLLLSPRYLLNLDSQLLKYLQQGFELALTQPTGWPERTMTPGATATV